MPLASPAQIQTDYNTAKAALAALQTAVDATAAALLAHEQACQALEADGVSGYAGWFRQAAALTTEGYQPFGNCNSVVIYARKPGVARDPSAVGSIGPFATSDAYKSLQAVCGYTVIP
jgi:hypothetical protein